MEMQAPRLGEADWPALGLLASKCRAGLWPRSPYSPGWGLGLKLHGGLFKGGLVDPLSHTVLRGRGKPARLPLLRSALPVPLRLSPGLLWRRSPAQGCGGLRRRGLWLPDLRDLSPGVGIPSRVVRTPLSPSPPFLSFTNIFECLLGYW